MRKNERKKSYYSIINTIVDERRKCRLCFSYLRLLLSELLQKKCILNC